MNSRHCILPTRLSVRFRTIIEFDNRNKNFTRARDISHTRNKKIFSFARRLFVRLLSHDFSAFTARCSDAVVIVLLLVACGTRDATKFSFCNCKRSACVEMSLLKEVEKVFTSAFLFGLFHFHLASTKSICSKSDDKKTCLVWKVDRKMPTFPSITKRRRWRKKICSKPNRTSWQCERQSSQRKEMRNVFLVFTLLLFHFERKLQKNVSKVFELTFRNWWSYYCFDSEQLFCSFISFPLWLVMTFRRLDAVTNIFPFGAIRVIHLIEKSTSRK